MNNDMSIILDYYDRTVVEMIMKKYGISFMEALSRFLYSETYRMLKDPELEMWEFSNHGIFDMWEAEQITGEPRNSIYIRGA